MVGCREAISLLMFTVEQQHYQHEWLKTSKNRSVWIVSKYRTASTSKTRARAHVPTQLLEEIL